MNKLETVQEAVAAANAAADTRRKTWTQARQVMKDVHRSLGYLSVFLKGNQMMEVDHGRGKSHGKTWRSFKGKGKSKGKSKGWGRRGKRETNLRPFKKR